MWSEIRHFVFLDCVLDASFTELDTHVVFPKSEPNEKTVQISQHSPNTKTLKLNFEMVMKQTPLDKLKPLVASLSPFFHLTNLSLYCLNKHQRNILLNYVGFSCPKLKHFCVTGFQIVKKVFCHWFLEMLWTYFQKLKSFMKKKLIFKNFFILANFCSLQDSAWPQ